jgi:GT2 family glycosyltransferase/glycosyltransferase involved in cell wall biosynthesis
MMLGRDGLLAPEPDASRLETLFTGIARALENGQWQDALRLADSTCRIAPRDSTCVILHARLLNEFGLFADSLQLTSARSEPGALLEQGKSLCGLGSLSRARDLCQSLLTRFAIDAVTGLPELAAALCGPGTFPGWFGVDSRLRLTGEIVAGSQMTMTLAGCEVIPAITLTRQGARDAFVIEMPEDSAGRVSLSVGERALLGPDLIWPPEFGLAGWVFLENNTLRGKVGMDWAPALPIALSIGAAGGSHTVVPQSGSYTGTPFFIPLDGIEDDSGLLEVSAVLPGGRRVPLAGSPVSRYLVSRNDRPARPARLSFATNTPPADDMIDIVVPVYAGLDETLRCIESVLATGTAELVVVNDASPDADLCYALENLARDGRITLLSNSANLGFPGAANRGMRLHGDRDVILLNADTEVFGDWLERLKAAAYSQADVGTATPLGESASIVSYPGGIAARRTAAEAAEIHSIAGLANDRRTVELPVGVGFCLYLKRACLADIGEFDEAVFSKGYGEENDFCLRAGRRGWRHVAATDVFVRHQGARSFAPVKAALQERNGHVLNRLYPVYDSLIAGFLSADPLLPARRAIDMERLPRIAGIPVLLVTSDLGGGVKRHVDGRRDALRAAGHSVITLQPLKASGQRVRLSVAGLDANDLLFDVPQDLALLRELLVKLHLDHAELHHFVGLAAPVLDLVTGLDSCYEIYVHDYSWICPRLTLVNGSGKYCGEPAVERCEVCVREHGSFLGEPLSVQELRQRSAGILDRARQVVAPAHDVRTRLARYFPNLPVTVVPWDAPVSPLPRIRKPDLRRIHVAVIGAISVQKGYRVLLECARDAAARNIDLDFVVIGYTCDDRKLLATGRAFITGPYADHEVGKLLEREKCGIAMFPSVVPETWCYALNHALVEALPIVAFDLGAIAERLRGYAAATLLPLSTQAAEINDVLLRSARSFLTPLPRKVLAMDTDTVTVTTNTDPQFAGGPETSVQLLPLPEGVYTFTVRGGAPSTAPPRVLALPAVQVSVAPGQQEGTVEFVARGATSNNWLAHSRDMIVARISGGDASLMLTSMRLPSSPVLNIHIQRLDADMFAPPENQPETGFNQASDADEPTALPARIVAHIHRVGDVPFYDGWAGCVGDRLWIEGFAVGSFGSLAADMIEYCGITADGYQTPWLGNQTLCGSRGRATPMMGCAIRLKPEAAALYDCTYTGHFVSGKTLGPFKNGDLCCSDLPRDPLWGIEVFATPRAPHEYPGAETSRSEAAYS